MLLQVAVRDIRQLTYIEPSGVSLIAGAPEQRDQAGRLLDLLLDGLRHHPPAG